MKWLALTLIGWLLSALVVTWIVGKIKGDQ